MLHEHASTSPEQSQNRRIDRLSSQLHVALGHLQIDEAGNGAESLARLREGLPDGLILDLLMPDMSGFDILREVRSNPETARLPVLIYTSKSLTGSERAQLESWNAAIVRKEDVSTRISAQPFVDWIRSNGLSPEAPVREHHA